MTRIHDECVVQHEVLGEHSQPFGSRSGVSASEAAAAGVTD